MKWISVSEQLPEKNQRILIYAKFAYLISIEISYLNHDGKWWKEFAPEAEGCCEEWKDYFYEKDKGDEVLYWQPLPPAPHSQQCESKCLRCGN